MINNIINYGIAGFGRYAENRLYPAFSQTRFSKLVALSKTTESGAGKKARQYRIPFFTHQVQELVKYPEIQAVIVTSPPGFHRQHVLLAAAAKKHVLVEKPIATHASEVEEMIHSCSENGVKLMAGFVMRFIDAARKAREIVQSGQLGRLAFAGGYFGLITDQSSRSWLYDTKVSGGGPVADLGSHFIDLLQFITGQSIVRARGILEPLFTPEQIERHATINLEFSNQILGSLYLSFIAVRESGLTFHGSKGKLSLQNFNQSETTVKLEFTTDTGRKIITVKNQNYYARMLDQFSESILFDRPVPIPAEDGLQNQKIIDHIYSGSENSDLL